MYTSTGCTVSCDLLLIKTFAFSELSCPWYNGVLILRQSSVWMQVKKRTEQGNICHRLKEATRTIEHIQTESYLGDSCDSSFKAPATCQQRTEIRNYTPLTLGVSLAPDLNTT